MEHEIKDLIEVSRWYGQRKEYAIAGGGNTSFKNQDHLWIKASGINLGNIDENGFCVLDRQKLNDIPNQQFSDDSAIFRKAVLSHLFLPIPFISAIVNTSKHTITKPE